MDSRSRPRKAGILLTLLIITSFVLKVNGFEIYEFCPGADAIVPFTQTINEQCTINWEILSLDGDEPFCKDGDPKPEALQRSQRGRFTVIANQSASTFSATLEIHNIVEVDESIYIISLKEHNQGHTTFHILDAYAGVIPSPVKASCKIRPSAYSKSWLEVHCHATVDIYGDFQITCIQDGVKAPFLQPPERSGTHLTAVFWMNIHYPIKCCAYDQVCKKDEATCTDFTFSLHGNASSTQQQEQDLDTADATAEITQHESIRMGTLDETPNSKSDATVNIVMTGSVIISIIIIIIMMIIMIIKINKKDDTNNNKTQIRPP